MILTAALFCGLALCAHAGDGRVEISQVHLDPPPFVIQESGSYLLTEDLTIAGTNASAIKVDASDVTIDLNGFTLQGPGESYSATAIWQTSTNRGLTVRNGKLKGWANGMGVGGQADCRVENVVVRDGGYGIYGYENCVISDCLIVSNKGMYGFCIDVRSGSQVRNCTVTGNAMGGQEPEWCGGISVERGSIVSDCVVSDNRFTHNHNNYPLYSGIAVGTDSIVSRCTVSYNTMAGTYYGSGIFGGSGASILDCVVSSNAAVYGIWASGLVRGCRVVDSGGDYGIRMAGGRAENCEVTQGTGSGIQASSGTTVINNTCTALSSGTGIVTASSNITVEANTVIENSNGISAYTNGCIFVGNRAMGNATNYLNVAVSGNIYGPITNAAVAHPGANYSF